MAEGRAGWTSVAVGIPPSVVVVSFYLCVRKNETTGKISIFWSVSLDWVSACVCVCVCVCVCPVCRVRCRQGSPKRIWSIESLEWRRVAITVVSLLVQSAFISFLCYLVRKSKKISKRRRKEKKKIKDWSWCQSCAVDMMWPRGLWRFLGKERKRERERKKERKKDR